MEIKGKKVLVLGLARTGKECARFLAQRGASVQVTDVRSEEELKQEMETLAALPIRYFLGGEELEWIEEFRPRISVLLSLTEDHLDRYPNFRAYCQAKQRIFEAQDANDIAILGRDDRLVWEMRKRIRARIVSFGFSEMDDGVFVAAREMIWRDGSREEKFPLSRVKIQGVHNVENMMAAIAAAKSAGVSASAIQTVVEDFPGLEHRLEFVREKDGVRYYNDSKETNVGAVVKWLGSFSNPVILLAGGVDKGGDYGILRQEIRQK